MCDCECRRRRRRTPSTAAERRDRDPLEKPEPPPDWDPSGIVIWTGRYANEGRNPNSVATSQGVPRWFKGPVIKELAPTWAMLKGMSSEEYMDEYVKILARVDPFEMVQRLNGKIMLCWCGKGSWCHRRVIAQWMHWATGISVPKEVGYDGPWKLPACARVYETGFEPDTDFEDGW